MKIDSKSLRYAHAEGHTDVCFTEDGSHIITCGHDGDVRIWADIEDDDPNSHCVGESAISVCFKEKRLYVATDNHVVQAYTYPAFDKDGIVTRFTAPVTHIKSTSNIEICSLEGGAPLFVMSEHKGPVLSIAICPQMKFTSTACGDGMLRIWDIDAQKMIKEISCVPKINTFYAAKVLCRIDFEPSNGKYLAYPNNREIILLDCESWAQRMTFTHSLIKCAISQCLFSPCGNYLAGSTISGQIAVWEIESGTCLGIIEHPTSHNVSAMAWNPKGNGVLVYCDVAGQLGTLVNCYGKDSAKTGDDVETVERADDDNAISLDKLKNETLGLTTAQDDSRPVSRQTSHAPSTVPPQGPFQPSATPGHLEHRYMCWNEVGIVRCHTVENGESTIDVEFHDANVHHGIHLNNYLSHTMASLSTTSFNTTVLAVYHSSDPGTSDQHLSMDVIALNGSRLSWLGATDLGSPCAFDNTGVLRLYDVASGVWMPIPLCELDSEKSQYEEQLVRWAHTTADVDILKDDRLLPLAAKYASRLGRMHLADKLASLAETWQSDDALNVAQNSHFQELDTQETYDVTTYKIVAGRRQESVQEAAGPLKPTDGESFMDWFTRNKSILEEQNADLTPSELTRTAVRTFKSVQNKNIVQTTETQKRKLDEESNGIDAPVTSAPKQSKLSAFAFQKKS
ncbi:Acidic nucleoplasmic DNA-binding protein 1 [Operophtera brumata]|uniref:Acidic nucleoplasmic DNA-binding protein 1 n=1 Tax=Operophtera brumata TaxID=104452 RepID=A0A0L7LM31_OPEBR|nr:Acidic nucleoplasmic DNA-binding protein 1 [Operophtera brumata]